MQPASLLLLTEAHARRSYLTLLTYAIEHKQLVKPPTLKPAPTSTHFPYQSADYQQLLRRVFKEVILPGWRAHITGSEDRRQHSTVSFYGASGLGKTRFSLEFVSLLRQYLQA